MKICGTAEGVFDNVRSCKTALLSWVECTPMQLCLIEVYTLVRRRKMADFRNCACKNCVFLKEEEISLNPRVKNFNVVASGRFCFSTSLYTAFQSVEQKEKILRTVHGFRS